MSQSEQRDDDGFLRIRRNIIIVRGTPNSSLNQLRATELLPALASICCLLRRFTQPEMTASSLAANRDAEALDGKKVTTAAILGKRRRCSVNK